MTVRDAGLAHEHWKQYYTPDEVEEVLANTSTSMIVSGVLPAHVRLWVLSESAPALVMGGAIPCDG